MSRNLKAFGIAAAMLVLSATAASTASATSAHVRIENGTGTGEIIGTQDPSAPLQKFKTNVGNVECEEFHAVYRGSATLSESPTLTEVEFNECELAGVFATINMGTCDLILEAPVETFESMGRGGVTIGTKECEVSIKAGTCTISIPGGQFFSNAVTYTYVKTGLFEETTGHTNASGITYKTNAGCAGGAGTFTNAVYEGTTTAQAFDTEKNQKNLTVVDT